MADIKVIFGSTTGNTENAANIIAKELGGKAISAADARPEDFNADILILGSSTWGVGEIQDDWIGGLAMLNDCDLKDKIVALFGEGDQMGFGDTFVDAVGTLYQKVTERGAKVIGRWSAEGYKHGSSTAEINGEFVGLALDEDNESELTFERIRKWCGRLKSEAGL
ncbi:MAG: flavodoxin [Victivallaceae bacterium]|nr:flavodoxin [Victivallaceae bacterium]